MLEVLKTRRAWITQRMANRFPPWAKIRKLAQSVGQQVMEPMGRDLEDVYWWENYNLGNLLLNTTDVNQVQGLYRLDLPPTFEFRTEQHADGVVYITPYLVRGKAGGSWRQVFQATNNSLEEFWYGVPSRITHSGESYTYNPVLETTLLSALSVATPVAPAVPGKLWLTLSNNGASVKNYKGSTVRSSVTLSGRDIHGKEATEKLYFAFNGTIQTKLAWSEVESITTEYVDNTAYLRVDWLNVGQTELLDTYGLHVGMDREKLRFWKLGSQSYGSTLQHLTFDADDLALVEDGEDSKHAEYEVELLSAGGGNINGVSMAAWPRRRWVVVTDGSTLHFFVPDLRVETLDLLAEATTEAVVQIEMNKEWTYKGDTVVLDYNMKRPFVRVLRTRWSVLKPDGTKVCISADGSEIAFGSSGWITHPAGTTFKKVGFQGDYIEYSLSSHGRYVFYLESIVTDLLSTEGQSRPATHVDVRVVHSAYDTAEASIILPTSVGIASQIGFDGFMQPWVIDTNGTAHRLQFHHDVYLADFRNKAIIVREEYTDLEVEA